MLPLLLEIMGPWAPRTIALYRTFTNTAPSQEYVDFLKWLIGTNQHASPLTVAKSFLGFQQLLQKDFISNAISLKSGNISAYSSASAGGLFGLIVVLNQWRAWENTLMICQILLLWWINLPFAFLEIEHLLKEQDRRIKKCRKNEEHMHALLSWIQYHDHENSLIYLYSYDCMHCG